MKCLLLLALLALSACSRDQDEPRRAAEVLAEWVKRGKR